MLQNNLDAYNEWAESFDKKIGSLANCNEAYSVLASCLRLLQKFIRMTPPNS